MLDMPRNLPPHLHREITRHGRIVYYVRMDKKTRTRIKADYGSPEFEAAYHAALRGELPPDAGTGAKGTLQWLVTMYRDSRAWLDLSMATRRQRENILRHVLAKSGREPFTRVTMAAIETGCELRAETSVHQARHFVDTMKGLFAYAKAKKLVAIDPAATVKPPPKPETDGFAAWTEDDVIQYEERWPRGTRERVMLDIFQFTGLRRGDAAKFGRQHVKDGVGSIVTEKTGTRVTLPILDELQLTLDAGPIGDLAFISTASGRPMTKESLGNAFRDACRSAGVKKSAHGLRKIAATRFAEAGATVAELEAIFGWEGGRMASLYTKAANRKTLAKSGFAKLRAQSRA